MMKEIKQPKISFPADRDDFLNKAASLVEDCVSVGGLAAELGMLRPTAPERLNVFGRLVDYARRSHGLSVEALARSADVELADIVAIETDEDVLPTPRTVHQLATTFGFPAAKLMELAGLAESRDAMLTQAAIRFAARSESTSELTDMERAAFEEFVKVLAEASDGG